MPSSLSIVQHYFPKVKKVMDATENARVEVTRRDNSNAKVRNHSACAMAVACKRTFGMDGVIISIGTAYLIKGDSALRYHLPASISREVVSFDREAGFDEGTYELKRPAPGDRLEDYENRDKEKPKVKRGPGKPVAFKHFTHGIRAAVGSRRAPDGITRTHG